MSKSSSEQSATGRKRDSEHLDHISDGCGCAEVWEQLSEYRAQDD